MYTIKENLRPVVDYYNNFVEGFHLAGLLQYKQQTEIGGDYISKVFRAQEYEINAKYYNSVAAVASPTYAGFIKDNICRILVLNAVERLAAACQAAPALNRFARPNSTSFLFTEIMNDGAFRGTLRGVSMNFLQSSLVLWPTVLLANRTRAGAAEFIATYAILDALLYPIDTVKTIMYANTAEPKSLRNTLSNLNLGRFYNGVFGKTVFNIPFAASLHATATGNDFAWAYWLTTIAAYPLLTLKTTLQTAGKSVPSFRGVVPFAIANIACTWQLSALATPEKLAQLKKEGDAKLNRE